MLELVCSVFWGECKVFILGEDQLPPPSIIITKNDLILNSTPENRL